MAEFFPIDDANQRILFIRSKEWMREKEIRYNCTSDEDVEIEITSHLIRITYVLSGIMKRLCFFSLSFLVCFEMCIRCVCSQRRQRSNTHGIELWNGIPRHSSATSVGCGCEWGAKPNDTVGQLGNCRNAMSYSSRAAQHGNSTGASKNRRWWAEGDFYYANCIPFKLCGAHGTCIRFYGTSGGE